jgi:hypothetical protein
MIWLFKLTVTPLLVGLMSLAVRRWGPTLGSVLIGLPWMTGPMLFILGLERGPAWVEATCTGVQIGVIALACYVGAYTTAARRNGWALSVAAGTVAFAIGAVVTKPLEVNDVLAAVLAAASIWTAYKLIRVPRDARPPGRLPWWDIPARMLATAVLVTFISLTADVLGPTLSGVVATFPVIMTVLGTFTHAQWGGGAAIVLLRAVLLSLISFVVFFVVVTQTVVQLGLTASYLWAALSSIVTSSALLGLRHWRIIR